MMGSGKSTIGHLLSKNINFNFLDVDKFIEKEEGLKIYDIFQKKGESYFRSLEEKITLKLLKNNKNIISLGGIDSSVSSTLSAMTGIKTIVLSMPIRQKDNQHDLSLKHLEWLIKNFKNVEAHFS